jgi:hypothetical protein
VASGTKEIDFWRAAYVECDTGTINATPKVVGCKAIPTPSSTAISPKQSPSSPKDDTYRDTEQAR